jgi:decaprenylphospho-beta-D-ribofuranose 2-oxidase
MESKRRLATVTYEFTVPFRDVELVRDFLADIATIGCSADHATLQRTVGRSIGPLVPSSDGWQFALELGCDAPGVGTLLDAWDERIGSVGGHVNLASDSRLRPDLLSTMYPHLDRWRHLRDQLDPGRHFCSDLSRRLDL